MPLCVTDYSQKGFRSYVLGTMEEDHIYISYCKSHYHTYIHDATLILITTLLTLV